jgi:hypothetical protein
MMVYRLPTSRLPISKKANRPTWLWGHCFVAAVLLLMTLMVSAQSAWPIGEVQIQGTATITKASGGTVTITDGSYTWFPGDTISNGSGQSLLVLDDGTTLGLGEGASATVSVTESGTSVVEMHQGSVLYTTTPDAEVQFVINDVVMRTASAADGSGAVGLIQVGDDGTHRAELVEGNLLADIVVSERPTVIEMDSPDVCYVTSESVDCDDGAGALLAGGNEAGTAAPIAPSEGGVVNGTTSVATTTSVSTSTLLGGFSLAVTTASTFVVAFDDAETPVTEPPVSP